MRINTRKTASAVVRQNWSATLLRLAKFLDEAFEFWVG
jgi:hypothetical protein